MTDDGVIDSNEAEHSPNKITAAPYFLKTSAANRTITTTKSPITA